MGALIHPRLSHVFGAPLPLPVSGEVSVPLTAAVTSFAWQGTPVAELVFPAGSTVALQDSADGRFALDDNAIVVASGADILHLDHTSHLLKVSINNQPYEIIVEVDAPWIAAGTNLFPPQSVNPEATAANRFLSSKVPITIAGHGARKLRLFFPGFVALNNGAAKPEVAGAFPLQIDGAVLLVDGQFYPIHFDGSPSVTIPAGSLGIWGEVIVRCAPGAKIFAITASSVEVGHTRPGTYRPDQSGADYGGVYSSAFAPGYLDGSLVHPAGSVTGGSGQNLYCYGPAAIVEQGCWDGREVPLLQGDSIGVSGWPIRLYRDGTRSLGTGVFNLAVPGSGPHNTMSLNPADGQTYWRHAMVRSLPNRPHTRVVSQHGVNSKRIYNEWKAVMDAFWALQKDQEAFARDVPLHQGTFTPRAQSVGNYRWTDPAQMSFNEVWDGPGLGAARFQMIDYIRSKPTVLDAVIDVTPEFVGVSPYDDRWPVGVKTTLAADAAIGAVTLLLTSDVQPAPSSSALNTVIEGGNANYEQRNISSVVSNGSGAFTATLTAALTKAHVTGTEVAEVPTTDGTHPLDNLVQKAANKQIDTAKRSPTGLYVPSVGTFSRWGSNAIDRMTELDAEPSAARKLIIDKLVRAVFVTGVRDRLDNLHTLAAHAGEASKVNLLEPDKFMATVTGAEAPLFTTDVGWSASVTCQFNMLNPSADDQLRYSLRDASAFFYKSDTTASGAYPLHGTGSPILTLIRLSAYQFRINDGTLSVYTAPATASGLFFAERQGDTKRMFKDGVRLFEGAQAPVAMPSTPMFAGISPNLRTKVAGYGASMTTQNRADLKAAIDTYLADIALPANA